MAVSCFVMGQRLSQYATGDVEVEDTQVFFTSFEACYSFSKQSPIFTLLAYHRVKQMYYCTFHKHANSEVQKPTDDCAFHRRQSSERTS